MILDRVTAIADALTPAEQRLVRELLTRPRDAALGTAGELAGRIGVHEATASRLAKKLGFESYATFREALRQEFLPTAEPATRLRNTLDSSRGHSLVARIAAQEIEALSRLADYVPAERLAAAADALVAARRVFVFARGNAQALAVMMERRLRRMGVDTALLTGDARDLAEQAATMRRGDAVLLFAFRRPPRDYATLVGHARDTGCASVAVADLVGPGLVPAADHLLFAPRAGSEDDFQTLTVPMAIGNALVLQMAERAGRSSLERLDRLGSLIARFEAG